MLTSTVFRTQYCRMESAVCVDGSMEVKRNRQREATIGREWEEAENFFSSHAMMMEVVRATSAL